MPMDYVAAKVIEAHARTYGILNDPRISMIPNPTPWGKNFTVSGSTSDGTERRFENNKEYFELVRNS